MASTQNTLSLRSVRRITARNTLPTENRSRSKRSAQTSCALLPSCACCLRRAQNTFCVQRNPRARAPACRIIRSQVQVHVGGKCVRSKRARAPLPEKFCIHYRESVECGTQLWWSAEIERVGETGRRRWDDCLAFLRKHAE